MACSEVHVNVRYGGLHLLVHIDGLMTFVPLNYRCTLSLIIASSRIHASDAESLSMPHCSSLRQLKHRVDSQPLVERKLSISVAIGGHRWPSVATVTPIDNAHCSHATPSKSRACCQPVWPSASTSRMASPRGQNLLRREDYARTVIGWPVVHSR